MPENLSGDIIAQTADTLATIGVLLQRVGSDKSRILDATIFLADKTDFAGMNKVWDAWVAKGGAPVRCTLQAQLMIPRI